MNFLKPSSIWSSEDREFTPWLELPGECREIKESKNIDTKNKDKEKINKRLKDLGYK